MSRSHKVTRSHSRLTCTLALACVGVCTLGCEDDQYSTTPATAPTTATVPASTTADSTDPQAATTPAADTPAGAKSVYGKAMERAERLKDEVAEYNKKLEDAADGKYK